MKKLDINVYRAAGADCTNGGISARAKGLVMVVYEKGEQPKPSDGDVMFVRRALFGRRADYLRPIGAVNPNCVGWMMGGNFGYSCDSRFHEYTGSDQPLPIHDRQETQAEYDSYSR